jgi:hypothetical protein
LSSGGRRQQWRHVQEDTRKSMTRSSFNVRILFEFIWWGVAAILFWFLRIIFDVDTQFHNFFISKDDEELFAAESRLPHGC